MFMFLKEYKTLDEQFRIETRNLAFGPLGRRNIELESWLWDWFDYEVAVCGITGDQLTTGITETCSHFPGFSQNPLAVIKPAFLEDHLCRQIVEGLRTGLRVENDNGFHHALDKHGPFFRLMDRARAEKLAQLVPHMRRAAKQCEIAAHQAGYRTFRVPNAMGVLKNLAIADAMKRRRAAIGIIQS